MGVDETFASQSYSMGAELIDTTKALQLAGELDDEIEVLRSVLRRAWGPDTCAPEDRSAWHAENPARGQCITSVLVVHDHLGGQLVRGDVHVHGEHVDYHWWNRLPEGTEIDLTREQFGPAEVVSGGTVFERPADGGRVAEQYLVLKARVDSLLR